SHELRTPLTAVIGFAELLGLPEVTDAERLEQARTIRESGEHLLRVLSDILDVSKLEERRMSVETTPFAPRRVVGDALTLLAPSAKAKGLAFQVHGLASLPRQIVSDATRLRQ